MLQALHCAFNLGGIPMCDGVAEIPEANQGARQPIPSIMVSDPGSGQYANFMAVTDLFDLFGAGKETRQNLVNLTFQSRMVSEY
jgi:hypothetical protein